MTAAVPTPAETAVTAMLASEYGDGALLTSAMAASAPSSAASPLAAVGTDKFEFDAEFQTKVATHVLRDMEFMRKVGHLIKPEYFEHAGEAAMVNLALRFYAQFGALPSLIAARDWFKQDLAKKIIRADIRDAAVTAFKAIFAASADLANGNYVAERVAEFARHQAMSQAILASVDLLGRKQFDQIEEKIKLAVGVGIHVDSGEYDYFAKIDERTQERSDRKMGLLPETGITTGHLMIDNLLYHRGWGRRELSVILGGPKSGKTTALIHFARAASLAGKNVLYVTLEVAAKIISERLDASISNTLIKELLDHMHDVRGKVKALMPRAGALKIHEFPSGTFTPKMLRHLIERYKSPAMAIDGSVRPAIRFDLVVVDYADIMAPNVRTQDAIENSKSVYLDLRAIAFEENVAMLSATQGNREGARASVLSGLHVADDYNKVRTVDIMISINITDEERSLGEARLYFAASRNQEGGFVIFIKQCLAKMQFIESIIRVE